MCLPNYISLSLSVINLYLVFLSWMYLSICDTFFLSLCLSPPLSLSQGKIFLVRSPLINLKRTLSIKMFSSLCLSLSPPLPLSLFLSWRNFGKIQSLVQCKKINTKCSTFKASFSVKVIYLPTWTRSQRSNSSIPFMVSMVPPCLPTYCWTVYL